MVYLRIFLLGLLILLVVAGFYFYIYSPTAKTPRLEDKIEQSDKLIEPKESPNSKNNQLANPASENCIKLGGTLTLENGPKGQYGVCTFEDNMQCEEWALFKGDCPKGGIKITGFDNKEQIYCAISGGKTTATKDAKCILPNGEICSDLDFYNGSCPKN